MLNIQPRGKSRELSKCLKWKQMGRAGYCCGATAHGSRIRQEKLLDSSWERL